MESDSPTWNKRMGVLQKKRKKRTKRLGNDTASSGQYLLRQYIQVLPTPGRATLNIIKKV